jgi:hypothetical protein
MLMAEPVTAEHQDHARPLPDHVTGGGAAGQERRPQRGDDRLLDVGVAHLGQRGVDSSRGRGGPTEIDEAPGL